MPLVTGTLSDIAPKSLAALNPEIIVTLSEPTTRAGRLFTTKPLVIVPEPSGYFAFEVASTSGMIPYAWYELTIRWISATGGFDHLRWRLRVPNDGGQIGHLLEAPAGADNIWIGAEPPPVDGPIWIKNDENPARVMRYRN
jgi:hypothetical protein